MDVKLNTKNYLLTIIMTFIFIMSCKDSIIVEPKEDDTREDILIYERILTNVFSSPKGTIIIDDSTQIAFEILLGIEYPEVFYRNAERLSKETFESLILKNQKRVKLDCLPNSKYVFSSKYSGTYSEYLSAYVSQIGYNKEKTQAAVTMGVIGMIQSYRVGYGLFFFLEKENGEWQIINKMKLWTY